MKIGLVLDLVLSEALLSSLAHRWYAVLPKLFLSEGYAVKMLHTRVLLVLLKLYLSGRV